MILMGTDWLPKVLLAMTVAVCIRTWLLQIIVAFSALVFSVSSCIPITCNVNSGGLSSLTGNSLEQTSVVIVPAGGVLARNNKLKVSTKSQSQMKCFYCSQNHSSDECLKHTTRHATTEKLKGLCLKCLQNGYVAKNHEPSSIVVVDL